MREGRDAPSAMRLGVIGALLGGATVMSQAAADARFLAQLGPQTLAGAMALSSALLALVLVVVGALADRAAKRSVLAGLALVAAVALSGFAALAQVAPTAAAWLGFLGAKQLAAAADLSFWMVATERLDARQSVQALPRLSAVGGMGGAVSAALAVPLSRVGGASGVMLAAAGLLAVAALVAWRLPAGNAAASGAASGAASAGGGLALGGVLRRSVRDGVTCVVESPLARRLAALVGLGGAFAALVYVGMAARAASAGSGSDAELTALLSGVRSAAQIATVVAQLVLAPWLLRRFGTASALLISPLLAVIGAAVVAAAPSLATFVALSIASRALDQAVETPAQKLVHTLLPMASRGRVVGFVEGIAKRSGAVVAGVLAAGMVEWTMGFGALVAASAVGWMVAAVVMARRMPALAVASGAGGAAGMTTRSPSLGPRALQRLRQALGEEGGAEERARAIEVLVKQASEGQTAACATLVEAAVKVGSVELWEGAALALAHTPAKKVQGQWRGEIEAAVERARGKGAEGEDEEVAALGALALADGAGDGDGEADAEAGADAESDAAELTERVAYAAAQAARWRRDPPSAIAAAADELRHGEAPTRALAAAELRRFALRVLVDGDEPLGLAVAWPLLTSVRRAADDGARVTALHLLTELVERLAARRSAEVALLRAELRALAHQLVEARRGETLAAAPAAAAVKLFGSLLSAETELSPDLGDELALAVALLADRDEEVSEAATLAVRRIGVAATAALLTLAGYGRRAARDRAAALLRELPATPSALDQLVELELSALETTCLALGALVAAPAAAADPPTARTAAPAAPAAADPPTARAAALDALLARRLDERGREIAYTVLLLAAARDRRPPIGAAAAQWRSARGRYERARALAVLDTTLPRPLAARLLEAVDEAAPLPRAQAVARRSARAIPSAPEAIGGELGGGDTSSRRILLARLPPAALARHRGALAGAAHQLARTADPERLLRRLSDPLSDLVAAADEGADMPSPVETLLALSQLPLFANLSTRQLDELARRARRRRAAAGAVIAARGQPLETLILVEEGELQAGSAPVISAGQLVDELAWLAPRPPADDLLASCDSRLLEIDRAAFEELADDVPGLGAGVCRALAERLRLRTG